MKKTTWMRKSIGLISLVTVSLHALAQVSLAPTTLYTDANGISTLYVTNPGDSPQEVTVSFLFGYPDYNEAGELTMVYEDPEMEAQLGLGERIRTFPRSFVLNPLQQQLVRIQVRPDRNKADGMYFTRVRISSRGLTADAGSETDDGVATKVNFRFDQILAVFHRSGSVSTGIRLGKTGYEVTEGFLHVVSEVEKGGNAPFVGSALARLRDPVGRLIVEERQAVAFYKNGRHLIRIPLTEQVVPGDYRVELDYETKRADISSSNLVQAAPATTSLPIRIP